MVQVRYCSICGEKVSENDIRNGAAIESDGNAFCIEHTRLELGNPQKKKSVSKRKTKRKASELVRTLQNASGIESEQFNSSSDKRFWVMLACTARVRHNIFR